MFVRAKALIAVIAVAWIAIATSAQAVRFDGHVYQIVEVCEDYQNRTAWAVGQGEDRNYYSDHGTSFSLPCDFESPYIAPLISTHRDLIGQVIITRLPDAQGVHIAIVSQGEWLIDRTYAYVGHTKPPAYNTGKIRAVLFPQMQEFGCDEKVTYAEHVFGHFETQNALLTKKTIQAKSQSEWIQTRNALKREWRQAGRPIPWQRFLKKSLIEIAMVAPPPQCDLWFSIKANACRCVRNLPENAILPLSGAVVTFRSINKNNQVRLASVITDSNGYYVFDSLNWNVAGYFSDTKIWVDSPTGVVVPDVNGVVLEAHRDFKGTLLDLYANYSPYIDVNDPGVVISPNKGTRNGEIKAAKSILNVDFYVIPE